MMLAHLRLRRRVALLAAGALEGREREEVRAHVDACPRCRAEHAELVSLVGALDDDARPLRAAEPGVSVSVLLDRVERQLDREAVARPPRPAVVGWRLALPAAAAAALALWFLVPELTSPPGRALPEASPPAAALDPLDEVPPEVLDRLERNLAREHTARYLSDAQDVLLAVAATEADCDRPDDRLDVGDVPDRSRDLLARRALLVEARPEAVASARAVLDDVELALREVADLPSCVRRRDVQRLRQDLERRQLHMRIRLMTRELEG
jgi:hypothetical protein